MSNPRTIYLSDIAGHCRELDAWVLISDIASEIMTHEGSVVIRPSQITIQEGGAFRLELPDGDVAIDGFDAPECTTTGRSAESAVWSLGASVFYAMMGSQVMNGRGGLRQTAQSRIPYLRHGMPELSELTQRCLHFNSRLRPTPQELATIAQKNLQRWETIVQQGPALRKVEDAAMKQQATADSFWPEEMVGKS